MKKAGLLTLVALLLAGCASHRDMGAPCGALPALDSGDACGPPRDVNSFD